MTEGEKKEFCKTVDFAFDLIEIKKYCQDHPTCECPFNKEHEGCYFRGRTPREWRI